MTISQSGQLTVEAHEMLSNIVDSNPDFTVSILPANSGSFSDKMDARFLSVQDELGRTAQIRLERINPDASVVQDGFSSTEVVVTLPYGSADKYSTEIYFRSSIRNGDETFATKNNPVFRTTRATGAETEDRNLTGKELANAGLIRLLISGLAADIVGRTSHKTTA